MRTETRQPVRGYLYIATATFFWGVSATLGRAAFTGRLPGLHQVNAIDPLILSQGRATFSFLVLLPVLVLFRGRHSLRLPPRDLGQLFLIGILGVAASNYFYYLAIQRTNVATAIIVQYTAPIWVLLYTVARRLQKPTLQQIAAVGLAVTGIALVIGVFGGGGLRLDAIGLFAALLAAFSFAFYNIGGHDILARRDRWIVLLYTTCSASLFWLLLNPPWKLIAAHYSTAQWLFLLLFSLISVLAPFAFYFAGLQHLEPTRAIVVSCLEPVFSIVIAAVVLGELMRPLQVVGIVFVLAAITVVQLPNRRSVPVTLVEPIE
ncbi:MAG: DMT family transporter [Acidobacteriia bacterium]|nr:DMT family transporter [Terriglobia bacterium]